MACSRDFSPRIITFSHRCLKMGLLLGFRRLAAEPDWQQRAARDQATGSLTRVPDLRLSGAWPDGLVSAELCRQLGRQLGRLSRSPGVAFGHTVGG
jgi:hypothetical protein